MRLIAAALSLFITAGSTPTQFTADAIRAHMTFLASDLLEGRGTGTRGHRIAAEYVAAQYALAGLEPGANGQWMQEVPFLATNAQPGSTITLLRDGAQPNELKIFDQFVSYGDPLHTEKNLEADVVFAGFGVTAPAQNYDDYKNVDVRGKIIAIFGSAPRSFPTAVRAHHASTVNKLENAARHGASAIIFLTSPADAERVPWARQIRQAKIGAMNWTDAAGTPHAVPPGLSSTVNFGLDATKLLLGTSADAVFADVANGTPKPRALSQRARIHLVSTHAKKSSPNVVGLLRGSDPKLRDEYLVYTAHLDHLGITEAVNGDSINNGLFDNSSGIAVMIEIAKAMVAQKPRRSILFVATTAEEKGLKGADYFANNPTVAADALVGNINIDMLVMTYRMRDLVPMGIETNDLGDMAREVARQLNVELTPDPFPDEVLFVRSDQYPFIRRGIPAIYIGPGYKPADANVNAEAAFAEWLRTRYHSPKDDLEQPVDWTAALLLTEFDYRLGLMAANRDERPHWKPGDFFGETFGRVPR
jgi:hypothetical protein